MVILADILSKMNKPALSLQGKKTDSIADNKLELFNEH